MIFDKSLYNDDFFLWHSKYAHEYSVKTMDWFIYNYMPRSVIDYGCGIGSYLLSAHNNGIEKIKGFDIGGEFARKYTPLEVQPFIEYIDCTQEIVTSKYDCVISFETAEHIEPSGTNTFISNLVNSLDKIGLILFTAAPEGQQGTGHINCRPKEFWINEFESRGLVHMISSQESIKKAWKELGAPDYIINNLLVFTK